MAKNKATRVAKLSKQMPTQPQEDSDPEQPKMAMDDPEVKLQSLKALNDRLVKETHERRREFSALVQAKEALETDLTRNIKENKQVMGELTEACEEIYALELGKHVVSTFLQTQMEDMGGEFCGLMAEKGESERVKQEREVEIGLLKAEMSELVLKLEEEREQWRRVCSEKDGMRTAFDGLLEEASNLRVKVVAMEKNERMALGEILSLKEKCRKLMVEKQENEIAKGTLLKENETVKRMLDESVGVIGDLEKKMEQKMKEKVGIERQKNGLEMEIEKLEKQVAELNESALNFKQEKKESDERISELEKRIGEAMEKDNGMIMEVGGLVKELQKKDKDMGMLTQQRDSLELNLNLLQGEVENLRRTIEVITRDKVDSEEAKMESESIIIDLQRESSKLKEAIASLTESSDIEKVRNEEFFSELRHLQDALNEVSIERDDARKSFSDQKKSVEKLTLLLTEKEKKIEEAMDELRKAKIAREDSLNIKNDELERRINILVGERDSMEQKLLEAQSRIDDLKAKIKSVAANSEKALALLKKTCLVVCDSSKKGEVEASEHKVAEEVEPFVEHLDAIKTSFTIKEKLLEEMKQLLEAARAKEEKKKSFFTMVTAATTILAAVSAVYASRGR